MRYKIERARKKNRANQFNLRVISRSFIFLFTDTCIFRASRACCLLLSQLVNSISLQTIPYRSFVVAWLRLIMMVQAIVFGVEIK